MRAHRTPPRSDAEVQAWGFVLDALELAIDVDGLHPYDRGRLAELHDFAGWHACVPAVTMPDMASRQRGTVMEAFAAVSDPGGIGELPVDWESGQARVLRATLAYAGLTLIADLERVRRERGLRSIDGVGPTFARMLEEALDRYRTPAA